MTKRDSEIAFGGAMSHEFVLADVTSGLSSLPYWRAAQKARVIVTSPPYYGARDYAIGTQNKLGTHTTGTHDQQLGHEDTPYAYVRRLARTFTRPRSMLTDDGSLFVVIGDTFARRDYDDDANEYQAIKKSETIGIFGMFIAEMRSHGWMLWQEIVWSKPSVPPSGASQVRCTPSSERVLWFTLGKPRFDNKAVREEGKTKAGVVMPPVGGKKYADGREKTIVSDGKRCRRDVWEVCPSRDKSSHVAPFPTELVEIPILACSAPGDVICDPFGGTLTVQRVAHAHGRSSVCFDIIDHTKTLPNESTAVPQDAVDDDTLF